MITNLKGTCTGHYYDKEGYIEGIKITTEQGNQYLVDIFANIDNLPWSDKTLVEEYHIQEYLLGKVVTLDSVLPDTYFARGNIKIED